MVDDLEVDLGLCWGFLGFSSDLFDWFGGGVVAIVQPIHAPISRTAITAMNTGTSAAYNRTS